MFLLLTAQHFLNLSIAIWPSFSGGKLSEAKKGQSSHWFHSILRSWVVVELGCVAMAFVQLLLLTVVNYCLNYCIKYWDIRAGADGLGSWEVFYTVSCTLASKIAPPLITSQSTAVLSEKYVTAQPERGVIFRDRSAVIQQQKRRTCWCEGIGLKTWKRAPDFYSTLTHHLHSQSMWQRIIHTSFVGEILLTIMA